MKQAPQQGSAPAPPPEFLAALGSLRGSQVDRSIVYREVPGPGRVAAYTAAIELETAEKVRAHPLGRASFVVLWDEEQEELWDGPLRLVGQARIEVDADQATDPLLDEVVWETTLDCISRRGAEMIEPMGTVTREISKTFGGLELRGSQLAVELRCSWTPSSLDLRPHFEGWADALRLNAGLAECGTSEPRLVRG